MAILPNTAANLSPLAGITAWLSEKVTAYAEAQSRRDAIMQLLDQSDEELAAKGLKREDIVHHVFGDRIFV